MNPRFTGQACALEHGLHAACEKPLCFTVAEAEELAALSEAKNRIDSACLAGLRCPDVRAGVEGVRWVENCVRSADQGGVWVDYV